MTNDAKVIPIINYAPLSKEEISLYLKAKSEIKDYESKLKRECSHLESKINLLNQSFDVMLKKKIAMGSSCSYVKREAELVEKIGIDAIKNCAEVIRETYEKIQESHKLEIQEMFPKELKIIRKYEHRYNKHHK